MDIKVRESMNKVLRCPACGASDWRDGHSDTFLKCAACGSECEVTTDVLAKMAEYAIEKERMASDERKAEIERKKNRTESILGTVLSVIMIIALTVWMILSKQ